MRQLKIMIISPKPLNYVHEMVNCRMHVNYISVKLLGEKGSQRAGRKEESDGFSGNSGYETAKRIFHSVFFCTFKMLYWMHV